MYDDCCHVATTLSFSTPAKYMYRSAANFGLWALQTAEAEVQRNLQDARGQDEQRESHRDYATGTGEGQEVGAPPQQLSPPRYRNPPVGADVSPSSSRKSGRSRTSSMASGHLPWMGDTQHADYEAEAKSTRPTPRVRTTSSASRFSASGHHQSHGSPLRSSFGPQQGHGNGDSSYSTHEGGSTAETPQETTQQSLPPMTPPASKAPAETPEHPVVDGHKHIAQHTIEELRQRSIDSTASADKARAQSSLVSSSTTGGKRSRINSNGSLISVEGVDREDPAHVDDCSDSSSEADSDRVDRAGRSSLARHQEKQEARRMSLIGFASFRREKEYSWLEDKEKLSTPSSSQAGSSRPNSAMSQTVPATDNAKTAEPAVEEAHKRVEANVEQAPIGQTETSTDQEQRIVTVTGALPDFGESSMIRERVSADGNIRPMEPASSIAALILPRERVGTVSPNGPVLRWLEKRRVWDAKYRRDLIHFRKIKMQDRRKAVKAGYLSRELQDENPPLSAVAGFYSEAMAWEAVKGQDSSTHADGQRESAGLGVMLWSKLSMKPDARQEGKKALDALAKKGNEKLKRLPSDGGESIDTPLVEKEIQM